MLIGLISTCKAFLQKGTPVHTRPSPAAAWLGGGGAVPPCSNLSELQDENTLGRTVERCCGHFFYGVLAYASSTT
jgi:hypothetical protein